MRENPHPLQQRSFLPPAQLIIRGKKSARSDCIPLIEVLARLRNAFNPFLRTRSRVTGAAIKARVNQLETLINKQEPRALQSEPVHRSWNTHFRFGERRFHSEFCFQRRRRPLAERGGLSVCDWWRELSVSGRLQRSSREREMSEAELPAPFLQ